MVKLRNYVNYITRLSSTQYQSTVAEIPHTDHRFLVCYFVLLRVYKHNMKLNRIYAFSALSDSH